MDEKSKTMRQNFAGQQVIVSAGGSGIGYAIAKAYEALGSTVFCL